MDGTCAAVVLMVSSMSSRRANWSQVNALLWGCESVALLQGSSHKNVVMWVCVSDEYNKFELWWGEQWHSLTVVYHWQDAHLYKYQKYLHCIGFFFSWEDQGLCCVWLWYRELKAKLPLAETSLIIQIYIPQWYRQCYLLAQLKSALMERLLLLNISEYILLLVQTLRLSLYRHML